VIGPAASSVDSQGDDKTGPAAVAIVAVHGLGRLQPGDFRDQFASGLQSYLNGRETVANSGKRWIAMIYLPRVREKASVLSTTAVRLCRDDEADPSRPAMRFYDVYDGYWRTVDEGKSFVNLLGWLVKCTFFPRSSTASIPATWSKLIWDIGYLLMFLLGIALMTALGIAAAQFALRNFSILTAPPSLSGMASAVSGTPAAGDKPISLIKLITEPLSALGDLPPIATTQLVVAFLAAYLCVQLVSILNSNIARNRRTAELRQDSSHGDGFEVELLRAANFRRLSTVLMFTFTVICLVYVLLLARLLHPGLLTNIAWFFAALVIAVAAWQSVRALSRRLIEEFRDLQTFATSGRASNSGSREDMVAAVRDAINYPLNAVRSAGPGSGEVLYDKVHVAAHSLGSSIALDALASMWKGVYQGAITLADWGRVRSFVTFGSTIEKARFLRDAQQITINPEIRQSENDIHGRIFTTDRAALTSPDNAYGIYWANVWYFGDVLANAVVSYRSDVMPNAELMAWTTSVQRRLCDNLQLPNPRPFYTYLNGEYVLDPLFWAAAGAVATI
jgi:hypothetical protein